LFYIKYPKYLKLQPGDVVFQMFLDVKDVKIAKITISVNMMYSYIQKSADALVAYKPTVLHLFIK